MVKILGVSGSPRKASTEYALSQALEGAMEIEGVETSLVSLRGKKMNFCIHCNRCIKEEARHCVVYRDDDVNELCEQFYQADGYIIASPVYEMGITPQLCTFFSRFRPNYLILKDDPTFFSTKVGGAISVGGTRNGGQESAINNILGFYHTQGILVANGGMCVYNGAAVWSKDKMEQGAREDEAGMNNARLIGRKVAYTSKVIKKGLEAMQATK